MTIKLQSTQQKAKRPSLNNPSLAESIELSRDEPSPSDLALIAVQIAANKATVTPARANETARSNSMDESQEVMAEAYSVWKRAEAFLQGLQRNRSREFAAQATAAMFPARVITFGEIFSKGMVPKCVGKKGLESGGRRSLGLAGFLQSLRKYFEIAQPLAPVDEEMDFLKPKLSTKERRQKSKDFLEKILDAKELPRETFESFLSWRINSKTSEGSNNDNAEPGSK